jgi:dipeptidyl aminopeptidase/acylaminoacyl peptidase
MRCKQAAFVKIVLCFQVVVAFLFAGCGPRVVQLPPLIPRDYLFGNPVRTNPQISPDGKYLAYLAPDKNNVLQLWVRSLGAQDDRQLTSERTHSIWHYTWTYSPNKLIFAQDNQGDENWQIHIVDIDTGTTKNLTPYKGVQSRLVAIDPAHPEEMLIAMNLRNRRFHDVYRVNLRSGETLLINRNGGFQFAWLADSQMGVRTAANPVAVIVRDSPRQPWKTARRWQEGSSGGLIGQSRDNRTIYLRASPPDGDTEGLLALDVESGNETVLAQDSKYDMEDVFVEPLTRRIQAVAFQKEKLEWQILDPSIAEDFATLAKVRAGQFTVVHPPHSSPLLPSRSLGRRDLSDRIWIVSYESEDGPTYHYTYERNSKSATLLFADRPKLEGFKLAPMRPVSFQSRDGLTIHGYLTLPVGIPAKNLPVVVLVHGGPWARDRWGYSGAVQWLANRGYGVLQVNYRGSTGYGRKFVVASYKEWGGKMHDDVVDGAQWLMREGIADPKRTAIMGASFGGYETLVGLTRTPEVFAAGVSRVGISSLLSHAQTRPPYWSPLRGVFARRMGDPVKDEEMLKSRSPLYFADRVQAPLLIAHGANDVRVVVAESQQMVDALRSANKPVEYFVYEDEGHGINRAENRHHFYSKAEEFLAKYLGGRFEPATGLRGHAGVSK